MARLRAVVVSSRPGWAAGLARPLAQGDGECLLHRILGDVDVTEDEDQGSHGSAGLFAEDPADLGLVDDRHGQASDASANGRISIGALIAAVTFDAQASAASRSLASMM